NPWFASAGTEFGQAEQAFRSGASPTPGPVVAPVAPAPAGPSPAPPPNPSGPSPSGTSTTCSSDLMTREANRLLAMVQQSQLPAVSAKTSLESSLAAQGCKTTDPAVQTWLASTAAQFVTAEQAAKVARPAPPAYGPPGAPPSASQPPPPPFDTN